MAIDTLRHLTPEEEAQRLAIGLSHVQWQVYTDPARFRVLIAGRRLGKCIAEGQRVLMADGTSMPVEAIAPDMLVTAIDSTTILPVARRVIAVADNGIKPTVVVAVDGRSVTCTENHPILTLRGWIDAADVLPSDQVAVLTEAGIEFRADPTVTAGPTTKTFDIEVEVDHNFVVDGIITHNTHLEIHEACRAAQSGRDMNVVLIAPTLKHGKEVLWKPLKKAIPTQYIKYINETELTLTLKGWESTIKIGSAERADALRGLGYDMAIFDEVQDQPASLWFEVIRPALSDRQGHALFCGTPKQMNWVYDIFCHAEDENNTDWSAHTYTTEQGGQVALSELEDAKRLLHPKVYAQEFLAQWGQNGDRVYEMFDRSANVSSEAVDLGGIIWIGIDFNVNPMSAVVANQDGDGRLLVFDEIEIFSGNTPLLCEEIKRRYHDREIWAFPDSNGRNRRTSSKTSETDFTHLVAAGFRITAPKKNPPIRDRVNLVNDLLCNTNGERRLIINPRCKQLIRCLQGQIYGEDGLPSKRSMDHLNDSLGYLCYSQFRPRAKVGMAKLGGVY